MNACLQIQKRYCITINNLVNFYFVLAGNAIIDVDGERISLNPKEGIEVSPLTPHQMFNESDQEVEFLVISQPNSHIKSDRVIL